MSMTVFLKLATGDLIDVEVAASETVGEVKRKTAKASRVQEEQIALSYEDNILNDAEVMDSLGLVQDAVIDVVPNRYQVALRMVEKATQVPFVPSNYAAITRSQIRDLTVLEHVLFLFENCPAAESDLKCAITEMVQVAISNQLEDAVLPLLARHPRIHSYLASSDLGRSPTVSLPFLQHLVRYFGPFAPSQIAFLENVRFSQAEAAPIVALLLENGLDINSKVQQKWYLPRTVPHNAGLTILMGLLGFGKIHTAILGDILKNGWADLSVRCCKGLTALHYAAIGSNYESLESMPGYGVDMTVVDFRQRTVLHHFVIKHHGSVMAVPDCLLQFAARQDSGGRTALFYLLRYGPEERGIEYNLKAFYSANGNMYREEDRNGETLLHAAVGHRSAQFTMGVVLQHAANVLPYEWFASFLNTKNHIGDTALDSCCKKHHITSLQALLSRGAVVGLGLTNAVFSMNKDIMRMLVVHHMDRSVVLQHLAGGRLRQCSRAFIYHLIRFEKDRYAANGMQLRTDPMNPCKAYGNGTVFDISKVFNYPVKGMDKYEYTFSPCEPIACSGDSTNREVAICQAADFPRSCGNVNQSVWFLEQMGQNVQWKILYPNGMNWRATWVTFKVDPTKEVPEFKVIGESPYEIYNFEITGKCLGQPSGWAPAGCN